VHHAGRPKSHRYLNKGLRSELTAISQYWLHYRLLNNWGLLERPRSGARNPSRRWSTPTSSPTASCFLDGFPNLQVLDPLRIGQNVKEIIECDWPPRFPRAPCTRKRPPIATASRTTSHADLFEQLMKDEEHHIDFLETQLDLIGRIGLELYTQKHVGHLAAED